ncbi:MAG: hypothetical protein RL266_1755 [Bacteroidota bacterium]
MIIYRLFILIFLFSIPIKWLEAGVVPSSVELENELKDVFEDLRISEKVDSRLALSKANRIHIIAQQINSKALDWATITYAYHLLENDSVAKAESILNRLNSGRSLNLLAEEQSFLFLTYGLLRSYQGNYVAADSIYRKAEQLEPEGILHGLLKQAKADNLRYQGKLNQSLVLWLEALTISEELSDSVEIADCYMGIGTTEFLRNELDQAEKNIHVYHAFNLSIGNSKKVAYALSVLSLIDYQRGSYEASIDKNIKAYEIRKLIFDLKGQGESLNNLALGYMGRKNWNQALRYLQDALQIKAQANDLTQMTVIYNNIGHCYSRLGNRNEALSYFLKALEKGKENGQFGDVVVSYRNLVNLYAKQNDFINAFAFQTKLMALKDSLAEAERVDALNELEVKYEIEGKEKEIALLQKEQTIITNRWLTLALGLFLTIVIGLLFIDNQKRKHRQEKQLLTAEDDLRKAELKIMTDLLEHNQQKLTLYTENLLRKNEIVGQLELKLKSVVDQTSANSNSSNQLIEDFSGVRILTDDDWEEFKSLFDGVHRGLLERLLIRYENLTLAEQRLFLLMKLGLSTKEIANILGVSPESVKKGRYRLKKKLEVEDDRSLQDFIERF